MVSSARNAPSSMTVNFGVSRAVEISVPRPTFAPSTRSHHRREQAGVDREQVVAGGVHQPLGRPYLPPDAAADRVIALAQPQRQHPHPDNRQRGVRRPPRPASPPASTAAAGSDARRSATRRPRMAQPMTASPTAQRQQGQARPTASTSRRTPAPRTAPAAGGGPATDAGPCRTSPRANPSSTARSSPCRPHPSRVRRRRSYRPTAPGSSVVRAPMVASLPIVMRADVEVVAVDPVPGQVHLGLDRAAMAEGEHAGHRRRRVQVDALADLVAQRPGVVHHPRRAGQVLRAAGVREPLGEPDPQVHRTAAAVGARFQDRRAASARTTPRCPSGPSGVTNSRKPPTIHHQLTGTSHGTGLYVRRRRC